MLISEIRITEDMVIRPHPSTWHAAVCEIVVDEEGASVREVLTRWEAEALRDALNEALA
jgi:hypothetical protein